MVCSDVLSLCENKSNQFTNSTVDLLTVDSAHRVPPDPDEAEKVKVSLKEEEMYSSEMTSSLELQHSNTQEQCEVKYDVQSSSYILIFTQRDSVCRIDHVRDL